MARLRAIIVGREEMCLVAHVGETGTGRADARQRARHRGQPVAVGTSIGVNLMLDNGRVVPKEDWWNIWNECNFDRESYAVEVLVGAGANANFRRS